MTSMKSVKVFLLVEQMAVVVPGAAHLLPAADMRQGVDHAAIHQAGVHRRKAGVHRQAIAAVGVLQHRRLAVLHEALAVGERHRDAHAVARDHPDALGHVLAGIVAGSRLLLEQLALAGLEVGLVGDRRGDQGVVGITHRCVVGVAVVDQRHGIGGVVRLDEPASHRCRDGWRPASVRPIAVRWRWRRGTG